MIVLVDNSFNSIIQGMYESTSPVLLFVQKPRTALMYYPLM